MQIGDEHVDKHDEPWTFVHIRLDRCFQTPYEVVFDDTLEGFGIQICVYNCLQIEMTTYKTTWITLPETNSKSL